MKFLQRLHGGSLEMDTYLYPTLYNGCYYLSMLGLKVIHGTKSGPGLSPLLISFVWYFEYKWSDILQHQRSHSSPCLWKVWGGGGGGGGGGGQGTYILQIKRWEISAINDLQTSWYCYTDNTTYHMSFSFYRYVSYRFMCKLHPGSKRISALSHDGLSCVSI